MIWNLANSSSALIDEDTKIDGYFIKSDGNKDVVFPLTGELDPVRAAKYEAENWSDLTVEELAENVPYFDSLIGVNVEDGTASELTIENRRDDPDGEAFGSIVVPNTCELHGYNGVFNYIDSDGNFIKNWERVTESTDGSGDIDFSAKMYKSGSLAILRNKTTGEVQTLTVGDTLATGWNSVDVEVLYQLDTPEESVVDITGTGIMILPGHNNILSPDSSAPLAMRLTTHKNADIMNDLFTSIDMMQEVLDDLETRVQALES